MSKAFKKDDDDFEDDIPEVPVAPQERNYITPAGLRKLTEEFTFLKSKERPQVTQVVSWAAGNGDRSENGDYTYGKKRLREIDKRLRFLAKRIEAAEVLDPMKMNFEDIRFGATVVVSDEKNVQRTYYIVGADESAANIGKISWLSPLAAALLRKSEGDVVEFRAPGGIQELEVIKVTYQEIPE